MTYVQRALITFFQTGFALHHFVLAQTLEIMTGLTIETTGSLDMANLTFKVTCCGQNQATFSLVTRHEIYRINNK